MPDPVVSAQSEAAPEYRYFFQYPQESASVGDFAGELQGIYGVSMTKYLNKPGDMTFSIRLDNMLNSPDRYTPPADVVLPITEPYGSSVWVHRNGVLVWGGLVTSRTWQSQGKVMNFTARTHDSYLERVHVTWLRNYISQAYPANMIYEIVRRTNGSAYPSTSFSIHADWTHVSGHPNYPKEVVINSVDFGLGVLPQYPVSVNDERAATHRELVDEAIKLGGEYRLKWREGSGPTPRWVEYETGQRDEVPERLVGTARADASVVLQYPGSIYRYWWPESMGKNAGAAGIVVMRGKRNSGGIYPKRTIFQDLYEADGTTPASRLRVTARLDYDTDSQTDLNNADSDAWLRLKPPIVDPTFEVDLSHADTGALLGTTGLDVGDYFKLIINDPIRFGSQVKKGTARCVGLSLTPPTEGSVEQFGVEIEEFLEDD